jgi:23S rRNA (adenine2503-C2)-methyltransferase
VERPPARTARPPENLFASHDAASLAAWLEARGETPSAARIAAGKALRHVHQASGDVAWTDEALLGLGLNRNARAALLGLDPSPSLEIASRAPSDDGSTRLLLRARDGALIESVLIPGPGRTTLCVSSQVGCARACTFCETGTHGLARQLAAGEIVDQVRLAAAEHAAHGGAPPLVNLVFMGMGEPFDNLAEVLRALRLLTDGRAYGFAPARVTVSTVGVADKIAAFFAGTRARLAVSLNAPDDARRGRIMPVNQRFPLAALKEALRAHVPHGRGVLFEYVLFDGVNDAAEDADALAAFVADLTCRVNVIPCNPGPDPALRPPRDEVVTAFLRRLASHGVTTLVRRPRGRDVGGACGQLAGAARRVLPMVGEA